ncbi:MAG: MerR family transcriptional regulator [Thermomicrobiales bacterium]
MMERLTIGEVARRSGISIRMLRHYDEIGLVRPERSPHNGYRHFRLDDIVRIQAIVALRQLGFGLSEINGLLTNDLAPFARLLELRLEAIDQKSPIASACVPP